MLSRLLLLMTLVPMLELWLLFTIAEKTSGQFAFGLVIGTGLVGATLARWQGWRAMQRIQTEISHGKMPGGAMLDGLLIFLAGVVLVTPGVMTDLIGLLLLLPPTRALVKRSLVRRFQHHFQISPNGVQGTWTSGPNLSENAVPWKDAGANEPPFGQGSDRIVDSYVVEAEPLDAKDDSAN